MAAPKMVHVDRYVFQSALDAIKRADERVGLLTIDEFQLIDYIRSQGEANELVEHADQSQAAAILKRLGY